MKLALAAVVLCAAGSAFAVDFYSGADGGFVPEDVAIFDDTVLAGGGTTASIPGIDTHGINVKSIHVNEADGLWGYAFPGGDGSVSCYFNGGQNDIMSITKLDGIGFEQVEFQVGAGWGGPAGFWWIRAFSGGAPVAEFDYDGNYGDIIGLSGGGFDEVRIAGYNDPDTRNLHDEMQYSAGAFDNFGWTGRIPSPGAAALLGLGGLMAGRRKR
jgi:hypothetical protein